MRQSRSASARLERFRQPRADHPSRFQKDEALKPRLSRSARGAIGGLVVPAVRADERKGEKFSLVRGDIIVQQETRIGGLAISKYPSTESSMWWRM
jgi:hypothetical protein